ncbi:MAG: histidine phosphatase family protein [Krumholzibacteria bacterium]|nr:histidine phosphatase family protein [Candidatus Krumholzibacteria bacterium]
MPRLLTLLLLLCLAAPSALAVLPTYDEPVRTVWLIRHGEYEHGVDTPDEGSLVALGRQQARLVATRLDGYPVVFTSLQASSMNRARETAKIVAGHFPDLELQLFSDIRECTPTTRRVDIMAELEPGEAAACDADLAAAWDRIFRPAAGAGDEHDIVVCHGNVIRWFVTRALDVDPQAWLGMSIANCSLTVIQVRGDGSCKLVAFADSGHVPWGMTTYPGVVVEP